MLVFLFELLACTSARDSEATANPTVEILSPADGETVCGTPLQIETRVENMTLVEPVEGVEGEPGTGHLDVMLNGQDAAMAGTETVTISSVEDGEYQLKVELSNADHTPVEPYAGDLIYLAIQAAACE